MREIRRHHDQRLKAKRRKYWGGRWGKELDGRLLGKCHNCPQPCSNECCGNQRKWYGPTRQELKHVVEVDELDLAQ